jgi:hypothetical protein
LDREGEMKEWYDEKKGIVIIATGELESNCLKCPNILGYIDATNEKGEKERVEVNKVECPCIPTRQLAHVITKEFYDTLHEVGRWQEYLDSLDES